MKTLYIWKILQIIDKILTIITRKSNWWLKLLLLLVLVLLVCSAVVTLSACCIISMPFLVCSWCISYLQEKQIENNFLKQFLK